jgi:hypothetical protein
MRKLYAIFSLSGTTAAANANTSLVNKGVIWFTAYHGRCKSQKSLPALYVARVIALTWIFSLSPKYVDGLARYVPAVRVEVIF